MSQDADAKNPQFPIELYKAYINDVESIGTRYTTANAFYMSAVTALLGVLALSEANKPFADMRVEIVVTVAVFAVIICWIWRKTIGFYRSLFSAKFEVLREMEKQMLFQAFTLERKLLEERKVEWLLQNEGRVPTLLSVLFIVLMLLALFKAWFMSAA